MKFQTIKTTVMINAKCGDHVVINGEEYLVAGYTDAGSSYLVRKPGQYPLFRLVITA